MFVSTLLHPRVGRGVALVVAAAAVGILATTQLHGSATDGARRPIAILEHDLCRDARPVAHATVLVRLKAPAFDLAHFIDADRPGGFAVQVGPLTDRPTGVTGDLATWRQLDVAMDDGEATALAWRLRSYPPIADARVGRATARR